MGSDTQHVPVEFPQTDAIFNQVDVSGHSLPSGALSQTDIEILDLIGEGEIAGLVTGYYPLTGSIGTVGSVGWTTRDFIPYLDAPNLPNIKYLRSIYWNAVPLVSSDNKYNYQRIDVSSTNGTPNGSLVNQSSPELTVTRSLNERLRGTVQDSTGNPFTNSDYIKYYKILNKNCAGCILNVKFSVLLENVTNFDDKDHYGDTHDTFVDYEIWYRPLFSAFRGSPTYYYLGQREHVQGKVTNGYIKSTRVTFYGNFLNDKDFIGWEIKIIRLTPDSLTNSIKNTTYIDSLTEVYSDTFIYPNSAIVRQKFSSEFFAQVPDRAFEVNLLKVKIPSNYDPILKTYDESNNVWDGTFKDGKYWTDNPAWCYYDLITNQRYGLGKYINTLAIDKWTLYEIGKYCDTLVPDGFGGLEPRFTCNLLINSRDDAYKVINDMASIFRGITYYGNGTVYAVQDSPKSSVYQFTNSNIKDGNFVYSSSSKRVRHTVAIVRYNDKNDFYKPAVEYVEDFDGIRQYGIRELEITAFGCTSRGQANRLGKWALITETTETENVAFSTGPEASFLRPGDIFKVFDSNKKINRLAGRTAIFDLTSPSTPKVTLDSLISLDTGSLYNFSLLCPTYYYDTSTIDNISGSDFSNIRRSQIQNVPFTGIYASGVTGDNTVRTQITLPSSFNTTDFNISGQLVWSIDLLSGYYNTVSGITTYNDNQKYADPSYDYYKVTNIKENQNLEYQINGVQYNSLKYAAIETGLFFERPTVSYDIAPQPPTDLTVFTNKTAKYSSHIGLSFFHSNANTSGITSYKVFTSQTPYTNIPSAPPPSDDDLIVNLPKEVTTATLAARYTGNNYFKIYSYNAEYGKISPSGITGYATIYSHNPIKDINITALKLYNDFNDYPSGAYGKTGDLTLINPTFSWQAGMPDDSLINNFDLKYRISVRAPSNSNIPSSTIYYQNTSYKSQFAYPRYTFDIVQNSSLSGGPYRNYDFVVEAIDSSGNTSAGNTTGLENGWQLNPYGYDIISIRNTPISGFILTSGTPTSGIPYQTSQWIDSNGSIKIQINSGTLPSTTVGGYVFYSTGFFSSSDIYSGLIQYSELLPFTNQSNILSTSTSLSYKNSGWVALSLYDSFDYEYKKRYLPIALGLYTSNIVPVYASGNLDSLKVTNKIAIFENSGFADSYEYKTKNITENGKTYAYSTIIDNNGIEYIGASRLK